VKRAQSSIRSGRLVAALALACATLFRTTHAVAGDGPTFADRDVALADGRDRSFALFANGLAMLFGAFGVEADVVVAPALAVAVDVDAVRSPSWASGSTALGIGGGVVAFPFGAALHALTARAHVAVVRGGEGSFLAWDRGRTAIELDVGCGWQWTWDYGLSVRVGAGPALALAPGGGVAGVPPAMSPELHAGSLRLALSGDASLGWAF
jgi:hypothetical protein